MNCKRDHELCGDKTSWVPTRLIDLTKDYPRLYISNSHYQDLRYATLSYCWGPGQAVTLLESNLSKMVTQIPKDKLPQTIQDAFTIARRLGIHYLWVDSLCIMQDSKADWMNEAALMGEVYKNCFVCIAATGVSESSKGCFLKSNWNWHRELREPIIKTRWRYYPHGSKRQKKYKEIDGVQYHGMTLSESRQDTDESEAVEERPVYVRNVKTFDNEVKGFPKARAVSELPDYESGLDSSAELGNEVEYYGDFEDNGSMGSSDGIHDCDGSSLENSDHNSHSNSSDDDDGRSKIDCFSTMKASRSFTNFRDINNSNESTKYNSCKSSDSMNYSSRSYFMVCNWQLGSVVSSRTPLFHRAWAFQERLMAPRVLHYTEDQLFWECREKEACQSFPFGIPNIPPDPFRNTTPITEGLANLKRLFPARQQPNTTSSEESGVHSWKGIPRTERISVHQQINIPWSTIVSMYSKGGLTRLEDKLPALAGVAGEFERMGAGTYLAGLWKSQLPLGLL